MADLPPIEIFRRGVQTAADGSTMDFTDSDLAAAAAAYDRRVHQAPLVIGHPQHDDLAYGWIAGLAYAPATGLLLGVPEQVDPAFAEAHRAGRLKYHSASFYRPDAATNPKPGGYYLRHLGFLGATPPAVKGLRPAQFAEPAEDTLTIEFEDSPMADPKAAAADYAEREAALATQTAALADRERVIAEREAAAAKQAADLHRTACASFADGLVAGGRVLPRDRNGLTALLAAQPADPAAAPAPQTPAAFLRAFLARLPVQVDYAERTPPEAAEGAATADFRAPAGYTVDPQALELRRRALAYQAAHPGLSYEAAVAAVTGV